MIILLWLALALLVVWMYRQYTTLSRAGVNSRPPVPFFGNMLWMVLRKEHINEHFTKTAELFPDDRIVGQYLFWSPTYIIRDLEIVKRITVTDFEFFSERQKFAKNDPMFENILFNAKGKKGKDLRKMILPAFSSSKLRIMVSLMVEVGDEMVHVLKQRIKSSKNSCIDVNVNDLTSRFATDVIFSCLYGLNVHTVSTNDQFLGRVKDFANLSQKVLIKHLIMKIPHVAKIFNIRIASNETTAYFYDLILKQLKINIMEKRDCILNVILEKSNGIGFTDLDADLIKEGISFMIGGFHTVHNSLSFILYELARNPGVQKKLVQEIKEYDAKCGGKLNFDTLLSMTYLDMVVSETLRLWPAGVINRLCVKDYNLGRPNNKSTTDLIIHKGEVLMILPWLFHRDPKLFPDPLKFDPERFSPENKANIKPYSYMPFGFGPRQCIANRFALLESKVLVYKLLREMEINLNENMCASEDIPNMFSLNISRCVRLQLRIEK